MSIHQKIRSGREALKMTEQQFADALDVSRGTVQQWEKKDGTAPNRKRQPAVAKLLGISVAELMGETRTHTSSVRANKSYVTGPTKDEVMTAFTLGDILASLNTKLAGLDAGTRETVATLTHEAICKPDKAPANIAAIEALVRFAAGRIETAAFEPQKT